MKKIELHYPNKLNKKIVVILPAYNEEHTVGLTITAFYKALPQAYIYVINNRSSDATEKIALDTFKKIRAKGTVINEMRPGKGNALRRAFIEIDADIYVLADADHTYPANVVNILLKPIIEGSADMVVGDRHKNGSYAATNERLFHRFGNWIVKTLVNRLFKAQLSDIMSGYRVFNRRFIKLYPILVEGFEIETDMTLFALDNRFRIKEIPIDYRNRPQGSFSKLNTFSDGVRVLKTITMILKYYRPMFFFGSISALLMILGFMAGYQVILDWIKYHYIYHLPLAILATGLELMAMVCFAIALILDSIAHFNKKFMDIKIRF